MPTIYQMKKPAGDYLAGEAVASIDDPPEKTGGKVRLVMQRRIDAWLASGHIVERKTPPKRTESAEEKETADG